MSEKKVVLVLDRYEHNAIIRMINDQRTNMIKQNQDTEIANEILLKVLKAPTKKQRFYKKEKVSSYER